LQLLRSISQSKWLLIAALVALAVAPTFISYRPYRFAWDDAEYLWRSILVSRAFWSGNGHQLVRAMVSIRPPSVTFLAVPWGSLVSWSAAGKCFFALAAAISLLVALCLYLLLRIGVRPLLLLAASLCLTVALGPWPARPSAHGPYPPGPDAHWSATAFLADCLFAWATLAAVLLLPLEARSRSASTRSAFRRGFLWGAVFSLGVLTKLDSLYFVALLLPALFLIRLEAGGPRQALSALTAFCCCAAPAAFYLLRWGRLAVYNAMASSYGTYRTVAASFSVTLSRFLSQTLRESPGMAIWLLLTVAAFAIFFLRRRDLASETAKADILAFLIVCVFLLMVLASHNREIRFAFPAIVALPFLAAIMLSGKQPPVPARIAALAAALVFCGLAAASWPMRSRPDPQSLRRADAVLALAAECHTTTVLLATDSPTLNLELMDLATVLPSPPIPVNSYTLANNAASLTPIQTDFQEIRRSDLVVFQNATALYPPYTNQRVQDYESYLRQAGFAPTRLSPDLTAYPIHCSR